MDDWETKYWKQKQRQMQQRQGQQGHRGPQNPADLPHFEPAHVTQDRQRVQAPGDGWREVDPLTAMYTNMDGMNARGRGPQVQTVFLREGARVYRSVEAQGFGNTMPLVRYAGPAHDMSGKEFEMRGTTNCYVIDGMEVVDLSQVDDSKMVQLVEVKAPWVGTLLVEKNAIIVPRGQGGPQLLND